MRVKRKFYLQLSEVLVITAFWLFCGAFLAFYKSVTYDTVSGEYIFFVLQNLSLFDFLLVNLIGPAIGGLVGGGVLIFLLNGRMRRKSFGHYILISNLFYFTFIFCLNTCARMLELCKVYKQKLIISREVVNLVAESRLKRYQLALLGEMSLRGKSNTVELFGVRLPENHRLS